MKIFLREVIVSFILSILLIFALALMISQTNISEMIIIPGIIIISSFSIMFRNNKSIENKKTKRNDEWSFIGGYIYGLYVCIIKYYIKRFFFEFEIIYNDCDWNVSRNVRRNYWS